MPDLPPALYMRHRLETWLTMAGYYITDAGMDYVTGEADVVFAKIRGDGTRIQATFRELPNDNGE